MSIMAPEQPIPDEAGEPTEIEVGYTHEDDVLRIKTAYGAARVKITIDFGQELAGPDTSILVQMLPNIIRTVHEQLNSEEGS